MANVTIRLSAKVMQTNATYSADFSGEQGMAPIVDIIAGTHYLISSNFSSFSSWAFKYGSPNNQLKLTYSTPNSATITYQVPSETMGSSTAIASDYLFKNSALTLHDTGALNFDYYQYGSYLSLDATGGVLTSSTVTTTLSAADADPTVGNVSLTMVGSIGFDALENFSGNVTEISGTATKYLSSYGLTGDFLVAGNTISSFSSIYAETGASATTVSGTLNNYYENYRDGSTVSLSGLSLPVTATTSLDESILSDASLFSGNDTIAISLGDNLSTPWAISAGDGDDTIDVAGGGGMLDVDAGSGNDTITVRSGDVSVSGGGGNDVFIIESSSTSGLILVENAGEGTDEVKSAIGYELAANIENLTLTGSKAINGSGNADNNSLSGNSGANILDGGLGNDTLVGGAGNDTYLVDSATDTVSELAKGGTDLVKSSVSYTLAANIENLTLTASAAIDGTGNDSANILTGNDFANTLDGAGGADKLLGGLGDDTYTVNLIQSGTTAKLEDTITENASAGTDTLELHSTTLTLSKAVSLTLGSNLESLDASGTGASLLNLSGNTLDNHLTGNDADNVLDGGKGKTCWWRAWVTTATSWTARATSSPRPRAPAPTWSRLASPPPVAPIFLATTSRTPP